MENFDFSLDKESSTSNNNTEKLNLLADDFDFDSMNVLISPICSKDGKKYAFINFSCNGKEAEGRIPECEIIKNKGFSDRQLETLVSYMKDNLEDLKAKSAGINIFENVYGIS